MAIVKLFANKDIINGLAVVGGDVTESYDATQRTQHLASGDSLAQFQRLAKAYIYHGGPGGSGNWEH